MRRKMELTECELATMKCIWDAKQPVNCRYIRRRLKEEYGYDYQDTTVYTFLKKLHEKGFVDSYKDGATYYSPLREEEEFKNAQIQKTKRLWFKGSSLAMISQLFQEEDLTREDKANLRKMLDEMDD